MKTQSTSFTTEADCIWLPGTQTTVSGYTSFPSVVWAGPRDRRRPCRWRVRTPSLSPAERRHRSVSEGLDRSSDAGCFSDLGLWQGDCASCRFAKTLRIDPSSPVTMCKVKYTARVKQILPHSVPVFRIFPFVQVYGGIISRFILAVKGVYRHHCVYKSMPKPPAQKIKALRQ